MLLEARLPRDVLLYCHVGPSPSSSRLEPGKLLLKQQLWSTLVMAKEDPVSGIRIYLHSIPFLP